MKTIHLLFSFIAISILTVLLAGMGIEPPAEHAAAHELATSDVEAAQALEKPEPVNIAPEAEKPPEPTQTKPSVEKKPEQPKQPAPIGCGPHEPQLIYDILIEIGVPRLAAIQQVGSWKHESGFDQCQKRGDGGIAWGLNSWHPGRRVDMPEELRAQIKWAIHTEMPRDCRSCYEQFMAAESTWSVRNAIQRSTRWGLLGNRWYYADVLEQQLK